MTWGQEHFVTELICRRQTVVEVKDSSSGTKVADSGALTTVAGIFFICVTSRS